VNNKQLEVFVIVGVGVLVCTGVLAGVLVGTGVLDGVVESIVRSQSNGINGFKIVTVHVSGYSEK
jgi:Mg2+/citrate symporter